jgi:cell division cycle 2-like protein
LADDPSPKRPKFDEDSDVSTETNPSENQMEEEAEEAGERPEFDETLPPYYPAIEGCRSLDEFQCLNRIAEGTYGVVYRYKDKRTDDIVALKKLKMEKEKEGFPITSLREINTLLKGQHPNIVTVREIVVGSNMDKIFIVMDYVEHDLKSLIEMMRRKDLHFAPGEVKCLLKQLLAAVAHLHDNWILHRDLKTSNLLLSHNGILKVGDFGLAREYGSPLRSYTPVVVTLWYRAPELLLCAKEYSTPIDMWSVGCIFAEFLLMNAIFPGKSEVEQINRIFKCLGTPTEKIWPGFNKLPAVQKMKFTNHAMSNLRKKFQMLSDLGLNFLLNFLTFDPHQRITADEALKHPYFNEFPSPIDPSMFPKWPSKSEPGQKRASEASPKAPSGGGEYKKLGDEDGFRIGLETDNSRIGAGFSLKF